MAVAELVKEYSVDEAIQKIRKNGKVRSKYDNFIGGKWVPPTKGNYFVDHSPINGEPIAEIAKSTAEDVEKALDAAHAAREAWGHTSPTARAAILNQIADVMQETLEVLAIAETIDNGKPIRETMNADVPLSIDHFRYFAACIRAEEGALGEIDNDTVA
jgi:aldehyde dehydrogenase